jgi:nicotinate-nucleotide adenylyltransferase
VNLGLFGGTFDPVHNAHLFVAEGARAELGLDRVVFLPSKGGPYREGAPSARAADRVAMLRLALAGNPCFALDESDLADDASGYTADVLGVLRTRYAGDALTFIVGGDSLVDSRWQRFDDVLDQLDCFAIAPRAERDLEAVQRILAELTGDRRRKIRVLQLPSLAESASLVRARLTRGESVRYIVPEPVWRYIERHGLYRQASASAAPQATRHAE